MEGGDGNIDQPAPAVAADVATAEETQMQEAPSSDGAPRTRWIGWKLMDTGETVFKALNGMVSL